MPVITIERSRNKPVLSGDCLDKSAAVPTIDFTLKACVSKRPEIIVFKMQRDADFSFVAKKPYAENPDGPRKPRTWNWQDVTISNDKKVVVEYANQANVWFNLRMKDDKAGGQIVTLDPRIKSGGETASWVEPLLFMLGALLLATLGFAIGKGTWRHGTTKQ